MCLNLGIRIHVRVELEVAIVPQIYLVTKTCLKHSLFPFRPESSAWSFSWFITPIFDYYGVLPVRRHPEHRAARPRCAVVARLPRIRHAGVRGVDCQPPVVPWRARPAALRP